MRTLMATAPVASHVTAHAPAPVNDNSIFSWHRKTVEVAKPEPKLIPFTYFQWHGEPGDSFGLGHPALSQYEYRGGVWYDNDTGRPYEPYEGDTISYWMPYRVAQHVEDDDDGYMIPLGMLGANWKFLDIRKAPHVLITGATGMGKSVFLTNIMERLTQTEDHIYMVDPLRVEFAGFKCYSNVKKIATNVFQARYMLKKIVAENDRRYEIMEKELVKHISELKEPPPYIFVIIDEFAQLIGQKKDIDKDIKQAAAEFENSMVSLAATSRKAGIHLIAATQNPIAEVVTALLRTNFPVKITFKVDPTTASSVLKIREAATLPGPGWMEYRGNGLESFRVKSPYVTTITKLEEE